MSKTTPVRWWRDDATRYHSRPPYVAPPLEPGPEWALERLATTWLKHDDPSIAGIRAKLGLPPVTT